MYSPGRPLGYFYFYFYWLFLFFSDFYKIIKNGIWCVSFWGYLFVFDGIPNAYLNSPSNCSHFDVTYMPFWYSCVNPSSSPGPSRCSKASVQKTDCRYGFSSKIWFIWYMTLPIWVTSNFPSSAFEKYLAFCGLIRMCTNMGLPDLESRCISWYPYHLYHWGTHILCNWKYSIKLRKFTIPLKR